ncbi:RICIN domain-containing protein [Streptomyces triculaminicus]|uniref:RICIN domain-containing protein n=1 Tax=Streptomyces triculaminicus TaxID=2816232 RepID=UPI0034026A70
MKRAAAVLAAVGSLVMVTSTGSHAQAYNININNYNSGKCLEIEDSSTDNGARAQQWDCRGQEGSIFHRIDVGPGDQFMLVNRLSGKCLEVADSRNDNGAPIQQWTCNKAVRGMLWVPTGLAGVYLNYGSGKALEVENRSYSNGARIQQWEWAGENSQRWRLG